MFEKYTEKARRVIFFARYEASLFGVPSIEPEHVLLGILREERTIPDRFFPDANITQEFVRREVEKRTSVGERIPTEVELPLAAAARQLLMYAYEESDLIGDKHIGTEHLMLGVLRLKHSLAARILSERGVEYKAVFENVIKERDARNP